MNDYIIMTDSCIDLPNKMAEEMELSVIPLSVRVDEKDYTNYLDEREITFKEFYRLLRAKAKTSTSQANPIAFIEAMTPILESGKDVIFIGISSALSGTFNSSLQAKEELKEKFPDRKIILIDSISASMGQGLLVTYAYRLKQEGKSIDEVAKWVEENKIKLSHLFTVDDLNHLKRGGRLSPVKAMVGTIMRVKPILHVSSLGKLTVQGKARGRQSAIAALVDRMAETIEKPEGQTIYISHGDCEEDALKAKELIINRLPIKDVVIGYIGPVIGSHSGPSTLAIFYLGNERAESDD